MNDPRYYDKWLLAVDRALRTHGQNVYCFPDCDFEAMYRTGASVKEACTTLTKGEA